MPDMDDMPGMGMQTAPVSSAASDGSTSMPMMQMRFHASGGDVLWGGRFAPTSASGVLGACVLLAFLGAASRWLHAAERMLVARWAAAADARAARRQQEALARRAARNGEGADAETDALAYAPGDSYRPQQEASAGPAWEPSCDLPRAAFQIVHSGILYLLMLAVMTYNVYYFTAVLLGLGAGECAFGRFGRRRLPLALPIAVPRACAPACGASAGTGNGKGAGTSSAADAGIATAHSASTSTVAPAAPRPCCGIGSGIGSGSGDDSERSLSLDEKHPTAL